MNAGVEDFSSQGGMRGPRRVHGWADPHFILLPGILTANSTAASGKRKEKRKGVSLNFKKM